MKPEPAANPLWKSIAQRGRIPLLVVRHGQTAWNAEHRFLGRSDIALDATGRAQVEALGRFLSKTPLASAHSSPLQRASATANAIVTAAAATITTTTTTNRLDHGV